MREARFGAWVALFAGTFCVLQGCTSDSPSPAEDVSSKGNETPDAGSQPDATDDSSSPPGNLTGSVEILAKFGDVVTGGKTPMRALVRDNTGKILGGQSLAWTSDTPSVATVDSATGI